MAPAEEASTTPAAAAEVSVDDVEVKLGLVASEKAVASEMRKKRPSKLVVGGNLNLQKTRSIAHGEGGRGAPGGGGAQEAPQTFHEEDARQVEFMRAISDSRMTMQPRSRLSANAGGGGAAKAFAGHHNALEQSPFGPLRNTISSTQSFSVRRRLSSPRLSWSASTPQLHVPPQATQNTTESHRHAARLLRSARFVPLIALKHAAEVYATEVYATEARLALF
jgi:hypothetical protein